MKAIPSNQYPIPSTTPIDFGSIGVLVIGHSFSFIPHSAIPIPVPRPSITKIF